MSSFDPPSLPGRTSGAYLGWLLRDSLDRSKPGTRRPAVPVFVVLGLLVLAYVVSVIARGGQAGSKILDGWALDAFEVSTSLFCLSRFFFTKTGRAIPLLIGLGLLSWSLGDVTLTALSSPNATVTPTISDFCYLTFYPITYLGVILMMRSEVTRLAAPSRLDGAVAGLGAGAVCAAFAFHAQLLHGSNLMAETMNLAFPVGDVLLLALVVGGMAVVSRERRVTWILFGSAFGLNAVGDTFNLLSGSVGNSGVGHTFNAIAWPIAILLISISIWSRPDVPTATRGDSSTGFLLPGLASAAALAILIINSITSVGTVAFALATATLGAVGVRLVLSVGALRSITELRHKQSVTDELTGLGNRRFLTEFFESHLKENTSGQLEIACLFVDLDRFKEVNDVFGHSAGDDLLRQLGPRLSSALRRSDLLLRLGGDEFAVLLPETDAVHATEIATRLVHNVEQPFFLDELSIEISASIGIAVAPVHATDVNSLLRCADIAMYRAKLSNVRLKVYDPNTDDTADLLRLVEDLRSALKSGDELTLHYQPQLELRTGEIIAVEALVRWMHPRLGMVPPLDFIPLAEEAGLMPALTEHVLDKAVAQCASWRAEGKPVVVSVNISSSNLLDATFCDMVVSVLERHNLPPSGLVLEVTETCMISDYDRSRKVINRLRSLGVVTSIDDFGAGFTSLAYLGELPVGELKLDRAFVADLAGDARERDQELVRSTISLGHALGLRVVAEGIEDEPTLELLTSFGCDAIQGYIVSRPVLPSDLSFDTDLTPQLTK